MKDFPHKLKRIIEDEELTVEEFANKLKVRRTTIYNIYSGQKPSMRFINSLIQFKPDIDLNWLLKDGPLDPLSILVEEPPMAYLKRNPKNIISLVNTHLKKLEDLLEEENDNN